MQKSNTASLRAVASNAVINNKSNVLTQNIDLIDVALFPDVTTSPSSPVVKIKSTVANFKVLLNAYGIILRTNIISKDMEIIIPWKKNADLNTASTEIISQCNLNVFPKAEVPLFISSVASDNQYNPITKWISSKEWDGVDRFSDVVSCIEVGNNYMEAKEIYLKRWCFSAFGLLDNNGDKGNEGVLVFQGDQGLGKTRWIKGLVGEMSEFFKDGLIIDPHNKDSVSTAVSHWIVEIGELDATFKKSDLAALKGFFTSTKDRFRRPYDRHDSIYPRTTVFFASVNDQQFLKDSTGDRRYWCLPTTKLSLPKNYDAQQFWAQISVMYNNEKCPAYSQKWYLTGDEIELRNNLNIEFRESDPIEELIIRQFDTKGERYHLSGSDVANIIGLPPSNQNIRRIGQVLTVIYGKSQRIKNVRCYKMPLPKYFDKKSSVHYDFQKAK